MQNLIKFITAGLCALIVFVAHYSHATVYYWDPEGTTSQTTAPGTWDNSTALWSTSSALTASQVAWPGNVAACFCAGSGVNGTFTVTVNTSITNCAGIFNGGITGPAACAVTLSGSGSIWLVSGADALDTGGGSTTIAVPLIGPGEPTLEGSSPVYLNAANTYSGGTLLGYPGITFGGTVNFNNGSSFGTGPIYHVTSGCGMAGPSSGTITVPNTVYPTNGSLNIVGNSAGLTFSGPWNVGANVFDLGTGVAGNLVIISGVVSGTGSIIKYNPATLRLNATNTFSGSIIVSNGTLALGATGSINSASRLAIDPGAIFDVSAISSYTLGGSTTLLAAGTGTASTTYAEINGASGGTVSLGSRPVILDFTPTGAAGDTAHPSLYVSQGTLKFSNNSITITNLSTNTLGAGTYRLVQVGNGTSGTISGTPNPTFSLQGTGIAAGLSGSLVISNGDLNLLVKPAPSFTSLTNTDTLTIGVGVTGVTLSGKLSAGATYPASGENIGVKLNGTSLTATVTNTIGGFSVSFNPANVAVAASNYPLIFTYSGDASLAPVTNSTTWAANAFFTGSALPGFFSGMNLVVTNTSGIPMFAWSTTNAGLPVAFWNLEGQMEEQPLTGTNQSRYSINVIPAYPQVFYICGPSVNWPYQTPTDIQWIDTDTNGNYTWYDTNTTISAQGVLGIPAAPVILQQPVGETVLAGKNAAFNVIATGSSPLSYQWYQNANSALAGMTNTTLSLTNVSTNALGSYTVLVSNVNGTAASAPAILTVVPPPQLTALSISNGLQWSGTAVAGETYLVQMTTNIAPPVTWITIATNQANSNGVVQFMDTNTLANTNVFYRLQFP